MATVNDWSSLSSSHRHTLSEPCRKSLLDFTGYSNGRAIATLGAHGIWPSKGGKAMDIKRSGSQPSGKGPAEYFTGTVRIDPLFQAADPGRVVGASVTFEPGARTAWHTHPLGQTLIGPAGCGRAQWAGVRPARSIGTAPRRPRR